MVKPKNGTMKAIKLISLILTLLVIVGGIVASHYVSLAELKDSSDACIDKKISTNDTLDAAKFADKALEVEVKALSKNMDELKDDVKDVKKSIVKQMEILVRMEERLKRRDSL